MTRKKVLIGLGLVVTVGAIKTRALESTVSASGTIRARRTVNITSEVSGKVVKLSVEEGDRVKAGQFLLQIDPRAVRSRLQISEASLEGQRIALQQARLSLENA